LKSYEAPETSHSRTMASLATLFSSHMHTKTRTWKNTVLKITELEILSMHRCLNRCLGYWFFSPYCIHLLRKPLKTDFLLFCCSSMHLLLTKK